MEKIQIISIIGSCTFLILIFELIRNKKLKEAYAVIWLVFALLFLFFSCWKKGLDYFANLVGIYYPPALLFLFLILALVLVLIQISVVISKQHDEITKLAQEIALLKYADNKNQEPTEQTPNTDGEPPYTEGST